MLRHLVAGVVVAVAVAVTLSGGAMAGAWEDGVAAYQRGDYSTALRLWQPLAESGDPRAENNLGLLYEKGLGVAADYETAVDWYRRAAAQGHTGAQNNLNDLLADGVVTPDNQKSPPAAGVGQPMETLELSGNDRWVQIASRQRLDEAVALARAYFQQNPRVVRSQNGWFAVVLGPYETSDIASFLRDYKGPALPPDATLTRGTGYVETAWRPSPGAFEILGDLDDVVNCGASKNVERSIIACTDIISAGTETNEILGFAHLFRGLGYENKGDHDRAIADFNQAIQLKPDYPEVYNGRGRAYVSKGDHDRAIADFDRAIQLKPDFPEAYNGRGLAYMSKGDYDHAIVDLDQAIQLKPDYALAYIYRGRAHELQGDVTKALEEYRVAARLLAASDPNYDFLQEHIAEIEAHPTPPGQPGDSGSVAGQSVKELCYLALTVTRGDWDTRPEYMDDVAEARRRNLSVADCRVAIGLPNVPSSVAGSASTENLCRQALNSAKDDWDGRSYYVEDVAEARRRNLSVTDCRVAIGLPSPSQADRPVRELCLVALNATKNDWDLDGRYAVHVAEAKRRSIGVDGCRAAIGLPSLPSARPAASTPIVVETPQPPAVAGGATIKVETTTEGGRDTTIISIEGGLVLGDEKRFADAAIRVADAVVVLSSPGGNLFAGIEIGRAIRLKGFSTVVPEGFQCASACAWAWLAGSPRFMGKGATVGFHAAYSKENGQNAVSSSANAIVGAYLNQLGLPFAAIGYITEAQPDDMHWLTFEEADQNGIEVRLFPSE